MFNVKTQIYAARAAAIVIMTLLFAAFAYPAENVSDFFRSIIGEWIGVCTQSTNDEQAVDKYFHAEIVETDVGSFESRFEYYRLDKDSGDLTKVGEASMTTTMKPDGTADCKIAGKGTVLVNDQPKNQEHELNELLANTDLGGLQGHGDGKISVFGMPLGLGKNGKVQSSQSAWNLKDDILTINQDIIISFRALLFTKKYDLNIIYAARRGSDVASLLTKPVQVTAKLERKTCSINHR